MKKALIISVSVYHRHLDMAAVMAAAASPWNSILLPLKGLEEGILPILEAESFVESAKKFADFHAAFAENGGVTALSYPAPDFSWAQLQLELSYEEKSLTFTATCGRRVKVTRSYVTIDFGRGSASSAWSVLTEMKKIGAGGGLNVRTTEEDGVTIDRGLEVIEGVEGGQNRPNNWRDDTVLQ